MILLLYSIYKSCIMKEINITDTGKTEVINETPTVSTDSISPFNNKIEENTTDSTVVPTPVLKKKFNFKVLIFPFVALLTLAGIAAFYYFEIYQIAPIPLEKVLSFNQDYVTSSSNGNVFSKELTLLSQPEEPKTEESPLNGLLFTQSEMTALKTKRPVVVMTDNQVDARPQSSMNSADIVIEANAEGGITRLMAIYWSTAPTEVGPIRSMREYFLEWASEYDPLIIHDGCASSDDPRTNACGNLYSFGVKDLSTTGAWRVNTATRFSPHNEYASVTYDWDYATKVGWDGFPTSLQSWQFKADAAPSSRADKSQVKLTFSVALNNGGDYDVVWTYDKSSNTYLRQVGGQADIDNETKTQVFAKDIVVQEVSEVQSGDEKAHLIVTTTGQGGATFLMDGKISYGTWKKDSRTDRTTYYDSTGKEVIFNRGRIWVEVLSTTDSKFDIIEQ
jgi:hypothetical protein